MMEVWLIVSELPNEAESQVIEDLQQLNLT